MRRGVFVGVWCCGIEVKRKRMQNMEVGWPRREVFME